MARLVADLTKSISSKHSPKIELNITDNPSPGCAIQLVHLGLSPILGEPSQQQRSLLIIQETGFLRPVDDDKFGDGGSNHCDEAFNDKDPAPSAVASDSIHVGDGVG